MYFKHVNFAFKLKSTAGGILGENHELIFYKNYIVNK